MKEYKVKFLTGSKKGEEFRIETGQSLSMGRSNTNTVILTEHDVSKKHCILRYDNTSDEQDDIIMEVISSRITKLDGSNLSGGAVIRLQPGQQVALGAEVIFTVQECGSENASHGALDEEETTNALAVETRDVSPDEEVTDLSPDDEATSLEDFQIATTDKSKTETKISLKKEDMSIKTPKKELEKKVGSKFRESSLHEESTTFDSTGTYTLSANTRVASIEEIENIKKTYSQKQKRRTVLIVLPAIVFLIAMIVVYFSLRTESEADVTWPADLQDAKATTALRLGKNVGIVFPSTMEYSEEGNKIEVYSAFGKNRDIPFHIIAKSWDDPASLEIDRNEDFKKCLEMLQEKDNTITFDTNDGMFFVNTKLKDSAGVPLNYVSYTRRLDNDDVFGYLVFFRYQNEKYIALFEVPFSTQWKTNYYIRAQLAQMFRIADAITVSHWEGTSHYRRNTTVQDDLEEARMELQQKAPGNWSRIFFCLQSALVKAMNNNQSEELEQGKAMLVKLRQIQTEWYSAQKLSYLYALKNKEKRETIQQIQASCESAFTPEFQYSDFRYDLIRRKVWK